MSNLKVLMWNIDGVKQKFDLDEVKQLFENFDLLIINETHFNIRLKVPSNFQFICKSKPIHVKSARGGVAIYKKISKNFDIKILAENFKDCVIIKIANTKIVICSMYIPPRNSDYFCPEYFLNLEMLIKHFKDYEFYVISDLNSRCQTPVPKNSNYSYSINPDTVLNQHGRTLLDIVKNNDIDIVNGLCYDTYSFQSNFTYFKGKYSSQNDICLSNCWKNITEFKILSLSRKSDHCPIALSLNYNSTIDLNIIDECATHCFSEKHYNIDYKVRPPLNLNKIDVISFTHNLENLANRIEDTVNTNDIDNDNLALLISEGIYSAGKNSILSEEQISSNNIENITFNENCSSTNLYAIADMHYYLYTFYRDNNFPKDIIDNSMSIWWQYRQTASTYEKKEFNLHVNKRWKKCKKDNGKKLWDLVDWRGLNEMPPMKELNPIVIQDYFQKIFNAKKIESFPVMNDINDSISQVDAYVDFMDCPPSMEEVKKAFKKPGKGKGVDGLVPEILDFIPDNLFYWIHHLICNVFESNYPNHWRDLLMFCLPKKGHSVETPKLRGISISNLFARIYDHIICSRFSQWYVPNLEQAGLRPNQGCLNQVFSIMLYIELSKYVKKDLYIALLDFEKAYDFASRPTIINKLISNHAGSNFIKALSDIFQETVYLPVFNGNQIGSPIISNHGTPQGRMSSGPLFSFLISDMPQAINNDIHDENNDYINCENTLQLADDTAVLSENTSTLAIKIKNSFDHSNSIYQVMNMDKVVYLHLSTKPQLIPLQIDQSIFIQPADITSGCNYLGFKLFHTNDIMDMVNRNLNSRMFNLSKFYSWLEINEHTPIKVKLLVLDSCMFNALLYSCETWGDITPIKSRILKIEREALKRILNVKTGTPNDLIYVELNRANIFSKILDRQFKFFQKIYHYNNSEAICKRILDKCEHLSIYRYYNSLLANNSSICIQSNLESINSSNKSLTIRYKNYVSCTFNNFLYNSYINDSYRSRITRWRLSCHKLYVEIGRYKKPMIPRCERVCSVCLVCEDEEHVFFICPAYQIIRSNYNNLISCKSSVKELLNPNSEKEVIETANFLKEIEEHHGKFYSH